MTNTDKIRQEIERRMKELERDKYINIDAKACRHSELKFLERFIDSLPEETCKDSLQVPETCKENTGSFTDDFKEEIGMEWYSFNKHLAEYGEESEEVVWLNRINFNDVVMEAFKAGAEWQKEQMMKEVKYGVVCKNGERDEEDVWIELTPGSLPDYKDIDPIDFIIVKE